MIGYWLQHHDYSSTEVKDSSLGDTLIAYSSFDWQNALSLFKEGEEKADCPPGIGVNNNVPLSEKGGLLLHICPFSEDKASVHFHHQKRSKIFGIFSTYRSVVQHISDVDRESIPSLISAFYNGDLEMIKRF